VDNEDICETPGVNSLGRSTWNVVVVGSEILGDVSRGTSAGKLARLRTFTSMVRYALHWCSGWTKVPSL